MPGSSADGFEIVSDLAPGFVLGAFYGSTSTPELSQADWDSLPKAAADQLKYCLGTAFDSETRQVIGPRFALSAHRQSVEENFLFGMRILTMSNKSGHPSALNEKLESILEASLREPGTAISGSALHTMLSASNTEESREAAAFALTLGHLLKVP